MKVTSIRQPQSSCPFKHARQKVFGLGYSLLIFVYNKSDDPIKKVANLNIMPTIFVEASKTGDYQMTAGLRNILAQNGNEDDLIAQVTAIIGQGLFTDNFGVMLLDEAAGGLRLHA